MQLDPKLLAAVGVPSELVKSAEDGGDDQRVQLLQALLARQQQKQQPPTPATDFTQPEQRQFARFGLDPERLKFLNTLASFRKGMGLEQELTDRALGGKITPPSSEGDEEELARFA